MNDIVFIATFSAVYYKLFIVFRIINNTIAQRKQILFIIRNCKFLMRDSNKEAYQGVGKVCSRCQKPRSTTHTVTTKISRHITWLSKNLATAHSNVFWLRGMIL